MGWEGRSFLSSSCGASGAGGQVPHPPPLLWEGDLGSRVPPASLAPVTCSVCEGLAAGFPAGCGALTRSQPALRGGEGHVCVGRQTSSSSCHWEDGVTLWGGSFCGWVSAFLKPWWSEAVSSWWQLLDLSLAGKIVCVCVCVCVCVLGVKTQNMMLNPFVIRVIPRFCCILTKHVHSGARQLGLSSQLCAV